MSWRLVTDAWRLKLLAVGLAVLMFGAVAFSQTNSRTLQVQIDYTNEPSGLVILNPPSTISVFASAPSNLPLTPGSITAKADASHLKKGSTESLPIHVTPNDLRIEVVQPPPITVGVDDLTTVALDVQVRAPSQAPGWSVNGSQSIARCGVSTDPCKVTFSGPSSVATGLVAFVTVTAQINAEETDSINQPVDFEQNGRPISIAKLSTLPPITVNPSTVTAHVVAKRGTATVQVVLLDDRPARMPPTGYRVTGITLEPISLPCTGPADAMANLSTITLPGVDLSTSTANATFRIQIPTPAGVSCSPAVARVTYAISPNPNVTPSG